MGWYIPKSPVKSHINRSITISTVPLNIKFPLDPMVIDHWFPFFPTISVVSTCQPTRQTLHGVDVAVEKGDAMMDARGTQGVMPGWMVKRNPVGYHQLKIRWVKHPMMIPWFIGFQLVQPSQIDGKHPVYHGLSSHDFGWGFNHPKLVVQDG